MNPVHDDGSGFDHQARRLHQAALAQVSPQTLMRLRAARHEAGQQAPARSRARTWRWLTATAFSAVLAVGLGVQWLPRTPETPAYPATPSVAQADSDLSTDEFGASSALDEDPDLYLWLASADAQPLAMESTP
jgi:anti-sigma-K factor RskA